MRPPFFSLCVRGLCLSASTRRKLAQPAPRPARSQWGGQGSVVCRCLICPDHAASRYLLRIAGVALVFVRRPSVTSTTIRTPRRTRRLRTQPTLFMCRTPWSLSRRSSLPVSHNQGFPPAPAQSHEPRMHGAPLGSIACRVLIAPRHFGLLPADV